MWIVNHKEVGTTAGQRTAHTHRVVLAPGLGGPLARRLLVGGHQCAGVELAVLVRVDQVPHPAAKVLRERRGVRAHDDLLLGEAAHEVGRKQVGAELGLTHTRGDVDDHPLLLALDHVGEDFGQFAVMSPHLEAGVDVLGKLNHVRASKHVGQALLALFEHLKEVHLLFDGHGRKHLLEGFELPLGEGGQLFNAHRRRPLRLRRLQPRQRAPQAGAHPFQIRPQRQSRP